MKVYTWYNLKVSLSKGKNIKFVSYEQPFTNKNKHLGHGMLK